MGVREGVFHSYGNALYSALRFSSYALSGGVGEAAQVSGVLINGKEHAEKCLIGACTRDINTFERRMYLLSARRLGAGILCPKFLFARVIVKHVSRRIRSEYGAGVGPY